MREYEPFQTKPRGAAPLLIEFEVSTLRRPSDYGHADERALSIGFISLELQSGGHTAAIDFRHGFPSTFHALYGLSAVEPWGVWGTGRQTAFLLTPGFPITAGSRLRLSYLRATAFGLPVKGRIFLNGHLATEATFDGTVLDIEITPRLMLTSAESHESDDSPDATTRPSLSIVMVSFDRPDLVSASAATLFARPPDVPFELIVVENGTRPELRNRLDTFGIPVRNILLEKRVSFGEANNIGVEQTRGDVLLLINNDVFVEEHCLSRLFRALMESSGVAAVGPVFRYPDGRLQEAGGFLTPNGLMQVTEASRYGGTATRAAAVDYISAACLMMWRRDFEAAGGFDPTFDPAYYEDADLCLRLSRWFGRQIHLRPDAEAVHIRNATSADPSQRFPLSAANALNRENFLSRWRFDRIEPPAAPFTGRSRAAPSRFSFAVLCDQAAGIACETAGVLAASLLSDLAPTVLIGSQPRSRFRVAAILRDHGREMPAFAIAEAADVADHPFVCTVTVADRPSPDITAFDAIIAQRRILYLPDHVGDENAGYPHSRPEFDLVVVSSEIAAEQCRALLEARGAPPISVAVLHEPVAPFDDDLRKGNLVVVAGAPGLNGGGNSVDVAALLNRFHNAMNDVWDGIVLVEIAMGFDEAGLERLRDHCERSGLRLIVNPRDGTLRFLLRRARIFVSIPNDAGKAASHSAGRTASRRIATAIAADCVTLVAAGSPEGEICDGHDRCVRYDSIPDLDVRLLAAASASLPTRSGAPPKPPSSPDAVRAQWARFVDHEGTRS